MSQTYNKTIEKPIYNKTIPKTIEDEIVVALSHFPKLKYTPIHFAFKEKIKKSTMQAQPKFKTLLKPKSKREYFIYINRQFNVGETSMAIEDLPSDVLIGWLGHELGHIMDYETMTNFQLMRFGIKYLFNETSIKTAERAADSYAVQNGMRSYILKTKNYILNHADIPETYKARIKKFYLSPEEIMELVD